MPHDTELPETIAELRRREARKARHTFRPPWIETAAAQIADAQPHYTDSGARSAAGDLAGLHIDAPQIMAAMANSHNWCRGHTVTIGATTRITVQLTYDNAIADIYLTVTTDDPDAPKIETRVARWPMFAPEAPVFRSNGYAWEPAEPIPAFLRRAYLALNARENPQRSPSTSSTSNAPTNTRATTWAALRTSKHGCSATAQAMAPDSCRLSPRQASNGHSPAPGKEIDNSNTNSKHATTHPNSVPSVTLRKELDQCLSPPLHPSTTPSTA